MSGRGNGGQGRGMGHAGGMNRGEKRRGNLGGGMDRGGTDTLDQGRPDSPGRSDWAPGHQKRDAGAQSARDFAPGHDGDRPGQDDLRRGRAAAETPEADVLERDG